ncbi:LAS superfamily LD-carboxypeptidase LdcB [Flavimobilis soli]|uniref:LAS superfamily LD-carboxypeptidase LdcB n=1 Tax=Flavimobilis soli TaxID=442709 RepID=A0A2A9EEH3_9MICO|nr:M15 family metallopeptidase [Flavimobilis soli]PFG37318.1 LAS superfamily LD-carboxypeptidase LdcB [Flavimobilis soli]
MARSRSGPTPAPSTGASRPDAVRRPGGGAPRRSDVRLRVLRLLIALLVVGASAAVSYLVAEQLGLVVTVERRGEPVAPAPQGSGSLDAASGSLAAAGEPGAGGRGTGSGGAGSEDADTDDEAGAQALFAGATGATAEPPPGTPDGAKAGAKTLAAWLAAATADVSSPDSLTVVVNKQRPLAPEDFEPSDLVPVSGSQVRLRAEAAEALADLREAAAKADVPIGVHSAYRSYDEQARTFQGWVDQLGEERATARSARPGHSEHQTGLAVDVVAATGACGTMGCFGKTPQARWLAEHAHEHGWVVRYQKGAEEVTGYDAEPWHLRYVGVEMARLAYESGATSLETMFGLPAAPDY